MTNPKISRLNVGRKLLVQIGIVLLCMNPFFPYRIHGQDSEIQSFSLKDAQEFAVLHSYDSLKSQLDVETAKKKLRETLADGFPQID
ncbi:MAG: hypothetical protein WBF32_05520, partial [Candidatus Aminicenantaceae bacterium]